MNNNTIVNWFVCIAMLKRVSATPNDKPLSDNYKLNGNGLSDQHMQHNPSKNGDEEKCSGNEEQYNEMERENSGGTQDLSSGIQSISIGSEGNPMVNGAKNGQSDETNKTHKLGENEVADSNADLQKSSDELISEHAQYPWESHTRTDNGSIIYYTVDFDSIFKPYRDIFIAHIQKYFKNTNLGTKEPEKFNLSKKTMIDENFCNSFSKIYKKTGNNINLANADGDDLDNDWEKLEEYYYKSWRPIRYYPDRNFNFYNEKVISVIQNGDKFNYITFTPYIVHESKDVTVLMVVVFSEGKNIGYTYEYYDSRSCPTSLAQEVEAVSGVIN